MQSMAELRKGLSAEAQIEIALVAARLAFPFWQRAFPEREHQVALIAALDAVEVFCAAGQLASDAKAVAELAYQTVSACDLPAGDIQRSSGFSVAHVAMAPWLLCVGRESKAKHNAMVAIGYSESIHEWAGRLVELEAALARASAAHVNRQGASRASSLPMQCQVTFENAVASDAESLASIRVEAMRESLERLGRFDPQRARARFLSSFSPSHTRHILLAGEKVGFFVVKPEKDVLVLDHLYVKPGHQGRGVGAAVLAEVFARADRTAQLVRVGALRDSASNRFYLRHGFVLVEQAEFDNYYVRHATSAL